MRVLLTILKKIFFWNYARNTWQWDVLCVLILVFIFLTPKGLFPVGERPDVKPHPSPVVTVFLSPEVVSNESDRAQIERGVKLVTGRSTIEVLDVRKVPGPDGKTVGLKVDIR